MSPLRTRAPMLAILAVALCACILDSGRECGLVGCENGASMTGSFEDVSGAIEMQVCVNAACGTAQLHASAESECVMVLPVARGTVCLQPADGNGTREVFVSVSLNAVGVLPEDGDRYAFKVTHVESGRVLAEVDEAVTYDDFYPNGPECDCEPCKHASITFGAP